MNQNGLQNNDNQIELTDLALTEDQQVAVKGGPTMKDCLVTSWQSGGHDGGGISSTPNLVRFNISSPGMV